MAECTREQRKRRGAGRADEHWRTLSPASCAADALTEHISPAYAHLIAQAQGADAQALKRQVCFAPQERVVHACECADPLGEDRYCVTPFLVHQYANRVLMLATGRCFSHCRYCFRRGFIAQRAGWIPNEEREKIITYLRATPSVKEILVSGGDPLTGSFAQVTSLFRALRSVAPDLIIRLCTRAVTFAPQAFTPELIAFLQEMKPVWIIPHINHPAELGSTQRAVLEACVGAGLPVQSQSVLLRGVNDSVETLCTLFHALTCLGVKPGYLFQLDLAPGTGDFRVPLSDTLALWRTLKERLSGLSLPTLAVDLPGGGGKFTLVALALQQDVTWHQEREAFSARGIDGAWYTYPF